MAVLNPSNAILAKARCKYGKQLTEKDYKSLLGCKSVSEVVLYLKNNTHYSQALARISESEVHRGQLEQLLKQKLFYDFDSLCRYEMSVGSFFSRFIVRRYEISRLTHFIILYNSNKTEDFIFSVPEYFDKHTDINLLRLVGAQSYSDLLAAVEKSPYHKIFESFKPNEKGKLDLPAIEDAMNVFMYDELFKAIDKNSPKDEKAELKKLFNSILDFMNISRIYRLRKYYRQNGEFIKKHLLPYGTLKQAQISLLCAAQSEEEFLDRLSEIPQGKKIKNMHYNYFGEISARARYNISKNNMYFSTSPAVVMLSYMFVTDIELSNIINIIESVRYSVPAENIEEILIYK